MVWTVVKFRIKNLGSNAMNTLFTYKHSMDGRRVLKPRKMKCAVELMLGMKIATGKIFIDKYFKPSKKEAVELLNYFSFYCLVQTSENE